MKNQQNDRCPYWDKNLLECHTDPLNLRYIPCGSDKNWRECHVYLQIRKDEERYGKDEARISVD